MKLNIALPVTHVDLHTLSMNISNEALSVNLPNRQLLTKLTGLVHDTSSFIGKKLSAISLGISQSRREALLSHNFSNKLRKIAYTDLLEIQLPTPEGLQSYYVDYITFLAEAQLVTARLYDDFLHPFSQWVSRMIQRPESVEEITSQIKEFDFAAFDKAEAEFPKHISGITAYRPYGSLFRNHQEWDQVEEHLRRMVDTDRRQPRDLVGRKVKEVATLLNVLMEKMQDPNGSYRPTPKVVKDLSDLTYKLAEHVTFYSIIESSLDAAIVAIKDSKETVLKEIKKL